ncbi:apolipophorins [Drosophila albomicans]|uniref:Apolipophorins n=1 Tax=Drosophila albomicans TaxID=7291 RepID=A0A6P8XH62_DROAB|nr:apolipophorins [Drosophila albomicans]
MAGSEIKSFILIGLLLATAINADSSCKKGCVKPDSGLLKYTPGHFYEYAFDSILTVGLSTGIISEADDTSLKVIGNAKVFANGNCDYTLQVGAIKVINTKQSLEKKLVTNIQKPVHFSWASGQVQPEICSDATDSEYALNIKRAIISLLQAGKTSESKSEVDVFGLCPTYTSTSATASGGETITKVRDLNQCAYREQINSGLLSGVVNEQAGIKSSSLLQADYSKELKLQNGVIEHVQLVEVYKFAGSVKGSSDVSAKVVSSLKLRNGSGGTPGSTPTPTSGQREASIIFQKYGTYAAKNIAALKIALSDLIDSTNDYVKKDTAKKFIEIIRLLRNSDTDTILELAAVPHPNKVLARKVYLDALFRTNTAESARAILKQLTKLSENEKLLGILSLNLVESVDKETLNLAAVQLLSNAPKELYLVVGNLISKFCLKNRCETSVVESISKKFVDGLKHCKANTKKDEERIVYVLKGIGNSHILVNTLVPALTECISSGRSNRIRVAALQAFSTSNCNEALNSKALEILKNPNEDSELRIEAYVTAVNCPTAELANQISEIVNSEKVYQVGSFISSSLKVIRDSTDANRELQRYHLGNIRVTKQFPQDYRRYSFNRGCSHRLDALGLSATTDYKLIYSQHGFLPRSARFNVSAEIFGTNFNVIEGNLRQENLEKLLEYYVGPKGLLNKDFDEIVKLIEVGNAEAAGGAAERSKRSIADDATKIAKKYKTYGSKNIHDLNLDLSLKLFGSELAFLSLGDNVPSTLDDIIKYFSDAFDKTKKELSSFEKQFTSHHLFLDAELSYPTGLGIPLELGAQGFAANKIDFAINVDVNDILEQNWQRSKYRFKFVPSVDVNVNILLGFNAQVLSTGLRVVSTAHSATGSDVSVSLINNGEGFNVNVDLPREKLELVNVQLNTEFFIAENDKQLKSVPLKNSDKKQKSKPINEDYCFNQLDIVGVNLCISSSASLKDFTVENSQSEGHVDEFHLSKPFSFAVYSTSERKFNFKGTQSTLPTGSHQWKLEYSTPGSRVSHDTSVAFELGTKPKTYGRIALDNPQIHLAVEAGITNDNTELVVYGQYEQNKDVKRSKIGFSKHGNEYKPLIEIHDKNGIVNNINGYRADGKINVQKSGDKQARFSFQNFQLLSPSNERIVINGWADLSPNALSTELHIAPGKESYLVKSNFKLENGQYEAALFVNNEQTPNNVYGSSVQAKIGNNAYDLQLIGQAFTWTLTSTSALKFVKGDNSNTLTSSQFLSDLRVDHQNKPYASAKVVTNFDVNKLEFDATAIRDQNHQVSVNVKYQSNQRTTGDYELLAKAKLNKHSIEVVSKCDANGNLLIVDNSIITSWGTLITVKGELGQRYTAQDVHIDLQGSAQFRSKEKALQWIFKALGTPEKTNGEFRVSRDNAELIKLTTESQHPLDKVSAAKFNLVLKNQLNAKGDFKIAKNGKGELTAIIETQKVEPKHKFEVDSKFQILSPKYDIDTSIKINGDTKLHFKTENIIDKLKFSTKNIFESDTKKVSLEANGALKGDWRSNGDIQGAFTLVTPDGHVYDGNLNRHITTNPKTHLIQGTANVQVNEQQPGNKEKRSIVLKTTLDTLNTKTKEFSSNAQLILTSFNGKKAELNSHVKHNLKEKSGLQITEAGLSVQGNLVENQLPVELSIIVDDYSTQQGNGRISFKFGDRILANLNGKLHVGQQLNGVPASYELQADLQAPQTNFRSFELNSHGKLLRTVEGGSGPYNVEFDLNTKTADGHFTRINTFWKGFAHQGSYTFDAQGNWLAAPLKFDGSYRNEKDAAESNRKWENTLNAQFGDKYIKHHIDINVVANTKTATVQWQLDTSHESIKNLEVNIQSTKAGEDTYTVRLEVKDASKKYELDSKWFGAPHKKGLELHLNLPKSQPIGVVAIVEILGERKAKVSVDIQSLADLDFKLNLESSYTTIDEFYIIGDWNSKKLQLDSYVLDIKAQNKSIKVSVKNAQDVIISGTATYNLKKDQNKAIIEGQGQFQKRGKTVSSSFKLTRQYFALSTEKEVGASYSLNGNIGPTNVVATLKLTNKEFNLKVSTCEEKRQCMNIQAQSTLTIDEKQLDTSEHGILVLMDLREIGYPYELEWKSRSRRQGFKHQYSLDGHISGNNLKYQLNINFLPNGSTIRLTLPKRQILFESTQTLPTDGKLFGHYEESAAFYIDKLQRPNDVARISAILDLSGEEHVAINSRLQLKIEHPTIRPLTVSGTFDADRNKRSVNSEFTFDIFKSPEQKIIAFNQIRNTQAQQSPIGGFDIASNHKIYSSGLRFNYEINVQSALNVDKKEFRTSTELKSNNLDLNVGANILANKDHVDVTVNALNKQIIAVSADIDWKKYSTKINSKLQALAGQNPIEIISELQPNWVKISLNKQSLINANAEIKLGKEFKFDVTGASGKSVSNGRVSLDAANFLQTEYKVNEDDFKVFVNTLKNGLKKESEEVTEKLKKQFDNARSDFGEKLKLIKQSRPDFDKLLNGYENQAETIIRELEVDPTLASIIDSTRKLIEKINAFINEISKAFAKHFEELHKTLEEVLKNWNELWKNSILKAWEQFVVSVTKIQENLREEFLNVYTKVFKTVVAGLEKYGPVLKNYAKALHESLKPVSEAVQELIKTIINSADYIIVELKEYLSKLPTFEAIRTEIIEQIKHFKLIEKTLEVLNNIFDQLHILPQTPDTEEFLQKLQTYLEAKLKQQPINDEKVLNELSQLLIKSLRSIWLALENSKPGGGIPVADLESWTAITLPTWLDKLINLPALLSFRSSVINALLNEKWENTVSKNLYATWLYSVIFQKFDLHGQIVDGQHVFTFDGQSYAYPGNCRYVLVQDSVDSNFTVIVQLSSESKLKAITLTDRDGNFVEVSDTVALKLNGKPVEYPQHIPGIHAWRRFYGVYLHSEYGVTITCTTDLRVCQVTVDGFYTSKTRGLLGNGNAEPYDDFLLIDGTIAIDSATFGNDYGVGKCNPVSSKGEQQVVRNEICSEIFGIESTLALNYLQLDPRPYRKECDIAVQDAAEKDKESVACNFALAYGSALKELKQLSLLPPRCLKCTGAVGQRELGEEFTVKTPTNKADLVFVVDVNVTPKVLSQLVAPAITEIRDALKSRGFTDVQVGVIAFDESKRYPALLTSDNGKINYKANVANVQVNGPKNFCDNCVEQIITDKRVLDIYKLLERFVKTIVPQSDENAFSLALDYPFRAGAAKSIIGVRSDSLEYSNWWKLVRAHITGSLTKFDGAQLHLIAPIKGLALEGVPADKLVGFNARLVATLDGKDNKKRSKLQFENDMGIDFVLNNGGWAFTTQNFDRLKSPDQKKVLNQVTSSIADTLFKTETISDCRCVPVEGLFAQHKCAIKSTSFLPNKKSKSA